MTNASLDAVAVALERALPGRVTRAAPSSALTTYRCGGPVAVLARVDREADLVALARIVGAEPAVPLLVIGRGSNLLIADGGFDGVGIVLEGDFERIDLDVPQPDRRRRRGAAAGTRPAVGQGRHRRPRVLRRHPGQRRGARCA